METTKTTLVLMAAGLGSRYKGGIKALAPVGPNGEIIMDYSVHDAIEAGFGKIVFVIRKEIEEDFVELIFNRVKAVCDECGVEAVYVLQNMDDVPVPIDYERTKPWGTCHAVLAARNVIDEPFCVLNADDFYGKMAFRKINYFLNHTTNDNELCMAGFKIMNTLSENGGVTRGVCSLDEHGCLSNIRETRHIVRCGNAAEADGEMIAPNTCASMNMWGMPKAMIDVLAKGFEEFLKNMQDPMTSEFLLPVFLGDQLRRGNLTIKVLPTSDHWFGVTYIEDHPIVVGEINKLIKRGIYNKKLYSDLLD